MGDWEIVKFRVKLGDESGERAFYAYQMFEHEHHFNIQTLKANENKWGVYESNEMKWNETYHMIFGFRNIYSWCVTLWLYDVRCFGQILLKYYTFSIAIAIAMLCDAMPRTMSSCSMFIHIQTLTFSVYELLKTLKFDSDRLAK